ncbi:MAG: phosphate acyltransferase, partial [Terriglobales bacterium]
MWSTPESARLFLAGLVERARGLKKSVVFPEGGDPRVLEAAARLAREGVLRPILIAPPPHPAIEGVAFVDAETSPLNRKYAALYY